MTITLVWQQLQPTGLEFCTVEENRYGWEAAGKVIQTGEEHTLVEYWIGCDKSGRTRRVYVSVTQPSSHGVLVMLTDEAGNWKVNGEHRPDLAGCPDVDLGISPLTNSLPIRRLNLFPGEASEVTAAWVSFPDLAVTPLAQRYTRLDERHYQYESLESDFSARLMVDQQGLVVQYGDLWQRIGQ